MSIEYPVNKITDKNEVVKWIEIYLTEEDNNLANVGDMVRKMCPSTHDNEGFIRDVANKMRRTGKYDLIEQYGGETQYLIRPLPKKSFWERNPGWDKFRTGFITATFSLLVGWLLWLNQNRHKDRADEIRDQHLRALDSALNSLQKQITDSSIRRK